MDTLLTERQRLILRAIVDDYVQSAEPVGSRTISKRQDVNYSPATIRNDMSDLEEMGYLEQPHTSAGRIPSQKGYRFYVDHIINEQDLTQADLFQFRRFFAHRMDELEQVVQHTATILSQLTNYTSIVLGPEMTGATLKHMQIIPLTEDSAIAIIVTNTGHVENRKVKLPRNVPIHEIERFVNLLNHKMAGVPLQQFKHKIYSEVAEELRAHIESYEQLLHMLEQAMEKDSDDRLYLGGMTLMLNQPEFKDVEKAKSLLEMFEHNQDLLKLLGGHPNIGLQVRIGQENEIEAATQCSIITASYSLDGQYLGTIGILGPTRMEYRKVIGLLNQMAKELPTVLRQWYT